MKQLSSLFLALLFITQCLHSDIVVVDNFDKLQEILNQADKDSLVAFDVDETLVYPDDALSRMCGKRVRDEAWKEMSASLSPEEVLNFFSIVANKQNFYLINEKSPELVQKLKDKGVKVIALTAILTGKVGKIPSMEDWRLAHLKELGFDFSNAYPDYPNTEFVALKVKEFTPTYKKGMIASARTPKGEVLAAFVDRLNTKPKHIYFIDDSVKQAYSVDSEMKKVGIPTTVIRYTAAEKIPCELDEELARFQIKHLKENKEWLKDDEAKVLLEKQKQLELVPASS